jgi:ribosomal protein S18 acetylase RimI-like enzyme
MSRQHILRASCAEDAKTIITWFPTEQDTINWGGPNVPAPITAAWIAEQFLDSHRHYYTLTDKTCGVCGIYFLYHMADEQRLHIGRFAIVPNLRRRGLARLMIDYAKNEARSLGVPKLTLNVYEHNLGARNLYEHAGFYIPYDAVIERQRGGNAVPMRCDISN